MTLKSILPPALLLRCFLFLCVVPALPALAQAVELDPPSLGSGTDVINPGAVQVDSRACWSHDRTDGTNSLDGPESLARVGVGHGAEVQAVLPNLHRTLGQAGSPMDDLAMGVKWSLGSQERRWPAALTTTLTLPVGSAGLTSGGVDPSVTLATSHKLPHRLLLFSGATLGSVSSSDAGRNVRAQLATDVGWCATQRACVFAEVAPMTGTAAGATGYQADGGFIWTVSSLVQLDVHAGVINQGDQKSYGMSFGYSVRRERRSLANRAH